MKFSSCAICDTGIVRTENQDNLYVNGTYRKDITDNSVFNYSDTVSKSGLYAVADGMGGEAHGSLAALVTVQAMDSLDPLEGNQGMARYLHERNAVICDLIMEYGGVRIGSTFVGLCINGKRAEITNIGDSRLYLFRGDSLVQLSNDHTSVQQMIDIGVLTKEAAREHPERNMLTQHLGIFPSEMVIEPYVVSIDIEAGDCFLLCSDGLTDMLEDDSIKSALEASPSIVTRAETLYLEALSNGGKDNITVILVQVSKSGLFG
jgi:serine/threonine protein phosphatase PrpC